MIICVTLGLNIETFVKYLIITTKVTSEPKMSKCEHVNLDCCKKYFEVHKLKQVCTDLRFNSALNHDFLF